MDLVQQVLQEERQSIFLHNGIRVVTVADASSGVHIAEAIIQRIIDKKTILYLSGGSTPKQLYRSLAQKGLSAGGVGMIDERFGGKLHENSNERMIHETGLLRTLSLTDTAFYPILSSQNRVQQGEGDLLQETADEYDQKFRELLAQYPKSIGILGIGKDGHTAGLLPGKLKSQNSNLKIETACYIGYRDLHAEFKERITITFLGLSMLDVIIILAFGDDKKQALKMMFQDGSEEEIPGRFYRRPDIAKKTLLITDQEID